MLRMHSVAGAVCGFVVAAFSYADSPRCQCYLKIHLFFSCQQSV
jgi:hypothetical protein